MTDSHCHLSCADDSVKEFISGRDFVGVHPWDYASSFDLATLKKELAERPCAAVGEIGLDRLRQKTIPQEMRDLFEVQLELALEMRRPVVLHGAKCWGQVVAAVKRAVQLKGCTAFLFHGFSRSDGLIPEIVSLNGYISIGPSILNDHAAYYRAMARKIPIDRLLVETDRTEENASKCPHVREVLEKLAQIRGEDPRILEEATDANAQRFITQIDC
jgi:TatD DNase family protein